MKSSDGDSWYRALIVDRAQALEPRPADAVVVHVVAGGGHDAELDVLLRLDDRHHLGDAGVHSRTTTRASSDFHAEHNWTLNFVWDLPRADALSGTADSVVNGWRLSGIVRVRSGNPLTPFLQTNRSRSLWSPSLGPGTGPDRPSYAPGRGPENAVLGQTEPWLDPSAFVLPEAGTFGNVGRNELIGPGLATVDLVDQPAIWLEQARRAARASTCGSKCSICSIAPTSARPRSSSSPARPTAKRRCRRSARSGPPSRRPGRRSSVCASRSRSRDTRAGGLRRAARIVSRCILVAMHWVVFAVGAALSWGLYGPALHGGQVKLGSPFRALLCVGLAYMLVGVVVPLVALAAQGQLGAKGWNASGFTQATLAGGLGALGAVCIIYAFRAGGLPTYVMPLVFGGAPVVNVVVHDVPASAEGDAESAAVGRVCCSSRSERRWSSTTNRSRSARTPAIRGRRLASAFLRGSAT